MTRPTLRLLPAECDLGWTPYAWLIYLPFQFVSLFTFGVTQTGLTVTLVGMAVFLVLYFRSYWVKGRGALAYAAGMAAIGAVVSYYNPYATSYFIYAAALVASIGNARIAWGILGAFVAAIGIYTWSIHLTPYGWVPAIVFSALVGALRIRSMETDVHNASLRMAHDEVERLAKVAERERIARDLHDVLGHTLSVIVLKSELASRLAERDVARAVKEIADVERIARESLSELREAIAGYRASGIVAEVQRARGVLETAGVSVECELGEVRVPPRYEGVLTLAIREAVTNIVRHAGASSCRLLLAQTARECRFEIADDGRGGASAEGSGLAGMRERVEQLGGTLVRDVAHGTRLTLIFPMRDAG
ncbi:MAG: sensor histidine kinase [Candidatus Eremiobacteraeota bacterium]|nr:sensor histidine kinase [Candidatus Eremiobacteraeota bacterium]